MSINLNRFNAQQISPLEDVRLFSRVFTVNGILQGCVLTHLGSNQVRITSGVGIIGGGDFEVVQEDLLVALSSSGTVPGRIYVKINLADTVEPIKIMSVAANPLPALTQATNFYETNGIWEMELATYSATTTAISGLTTKYISIVDVFDDYLKKSLIANTQAEVNAITVDGVPCGTKPVKELITSLNAVSDVEVVDIKNSSNVSIGKMVELGKLRILSVFSGANNNNADGTITTISDVPVAQLYSKSAYGGSNTLGSFRVDTDGKIYLLSSGGTPIQSPYVTGSITFVVN